jgi:hypothetical protein
MMMMMMMMMTTTTTEKIGAAQFKIKNLTVMFTLNIMTIGQLSGSS